ncbi:hypothetical protein FA15DRAFT_759963 [Coprinopsis marcescibilis]|uniref:Methyltransferase domain-containing protein n=1 Tax=Coprinopsis marcescibilis TaxID=230819 RepID=A0A5C3KHC4_COPMA|nr:hypothetical protein FA15DRAFT_759963 [Coprinopsis marcescibilis]
MQAGLVWRRNPRYIVALLVTISITIYILIFSNIRHQDFEGEGNSELELRIDASEERYNKVLRSREGLIRIYGPDPKDIYLFPPDIAPWPPYTVWDFFPAAFNCPHEIERVGALGDGGKWVCGLSRVAEEPNCIVYSFGVNYESSFEAEVLKSTKYCQIWGYDFSVSTFGPEIPEALSNRTHFRAVGLAGENTYGPEDDPPMYTLETLMHNNGHSHIDILKIDIEKWEFETLSAFIRPYISSGRPLPFGQLQLEIHIWNKTFEQLLRWWESLEAAGLRPFWTEPNLVYLNYHRDQATPDLAEYSFLNAKGNNIFISDHPEDQSSSSYREVHHPHAPV